MENEPSLGELAEIEQRAEAAHQAQDVHGEITALVDMVIALNAAGRDKYTLVPYVERVWETAEANRAWDQLHRLSKLFAQIALREENWLRLYDHYANACAYAVMARNPELLDEAMHEIDQTLHFMRTHENAGRAVAFCDMLLAYEEAGGLGINIPSFAEHYQAERDAAYTEALAQQNRQ